MVQDTDILIVGAGPAGVTLALALAQAKIPHTLVDRASFPRSKVDGNVYGLKVMQALNRLNPELLPTLLAQTDQVLPGDRARIFTPNDRFFTLTFTPDPQIHSQVPFFTVNRRQFDQFLVQQLDSRYTQFFQNTTVMGMTVLDSGWDVFMSQDGQNQTLRTKLLVGADGAKSTLVKLLGLDVPALWVSDMVQGYGRGIRFEGVDQPLPIEGHFLPQLNGGFFFLAPMADGTVNVGLNKPRSFSTPTAPNLTDLFHETIAQHPTLGPRFREMTWVEPLQSWPEVMGCTQRSSLVGPGYLLLGDAAGLGNPLTGFGTGNAMLSALLAAQTIQEAVRDHTYDLDHLHTYHRAIVQAFGGEFRTGTFLRRLTKFPWLFNQLTEETWLKRLLRSGFGSSANKIRQM